MWNLRQAIPQRRDPLLLQPGMCGCLDSVLIERLELMNEPKKSFPTKVLSWVGASNGTSIVTIRVRDEDIRNGNVPWVGRCRLKVVQRPPKERLY